MPRPFITENQPPANNVAGSRRHVPPICMPLHLVVTEFRLNARSLLRIEPCGITKCHTSVGNMVRMHNLS